MKSLLQLACCIISLLLSLDANAIRNGVIISESEYSAVGRLYSAKGYCTATLISSRDIITAAHCVRHSLDRAEAFTFQSGTFSAQAIKVAVRSDQAIKDEDIALLTLDKEIEGVVFPRVLLKGIEPNASVILVGFGSAKDSDGFGTKRVGEAVVSSQFKADATSEWSGSFDMYSVTPTGKDQLACPGDSGGPIFISNAENGLQIVGVVQGSPVIDPRRPCFSTTETFGVPLSAHKDWIRGYFQN